MQLSLKITVAMTVMTTLVIVLVEWLAISRESFLITKDTMGDCRLVGDTVAGVLSQVNTLAASDADITRIIRASEREAEEVAIRWVSLPNEPTPTLSAEQRTDLLFGRDVVYEAPGPNGVLRVHDWTPVQVEGHVTGAVHVSKGLGRRDATIRHTIQRTAGTVLLIALASGLFSLVIGRRLVGRRVSAMVDMAGRVGEGDYATRAPENGRDELGTIGRALNRMAQDLAQTHRQASAAIEARFEAEVELRHAVRLSTVGQLAAGMAHELGTPLNVISGRASLLAKRLCGDDEALADTRIIWEQTRRITTIVRRLLDFSRKAPRLAAPVDLCALAQEAVELLRPLSQKAGVEVDLSAEGNMLVSADANQILQVIGNLLMNAVQAMPSGGRIRVSVLRSVCDLGTGPQEHIHVSVQDTGTGIAPDILPRIFDPFVTTKEPGQGTGLGLSTTHGIVKEHGGSITVESELGRGSIFVVHLPPLEASELGASELDAFREAPPKA
jgi:two-component system, NtrC family, sensor kinase